MFRLLFFLAAPACAAIMPRHEVTERTQIRSSSPKTTTDCQEHGEINEAIRRFPRITEPPYVTRPLRSPITRAEKTFTKYGGATVLTEHVDFVPTLAAAYHENITDDDGATYVEIFGNMSPNVFYAVRNTSVYALGGESHQAVFHIESLLGRVVAGKPHVAVDFAYDSTDNAAFCKSVLENAHNLICASPVAQMPEHYPIVGFPNTYFEQSLGLMSSQFVHVPWGEKKSKVFWRGSLTGTPVNNDLFTLPRVQAYEVSQNHPEIFDFAFTHIDQDQLMERYKGGRKTEREKQLIDGLKMQGSVAFNEILPRYRYLLNVDGIVASFRLRELLLAGSVVLHSMTDTAEFFFRDLKPWIHFVPVKALGDIPELVAKLEANPIKAQQIAAAGRDYAANYLTLQGQDCYIETFLEFVGNHMQYPPATPEQLIRMGFRKVF